MVKQSEPNRVLVKCNVLFLGHSPPTPNASEHEALSDPLHQAYPAHSDDVLEGINAWLTIFTSGIQLQLVANDNPPIFWFPIQNLYLAAATKCINYVDQSTGEVLESKFLELGLPEAQQSSHAPLFSFISRRTGGDNNSLECYTFMTNKDESAFSMVEAARFAFMNKSGHSDQPIPVEVAAREVIPGPQGSSASSASDDGDPIIVNVDDRQNAGQQINIFPRHLVKRMKIDTLRPRVNQSVDRRSQPAVPPIPIYPSMNPSEPPPQFRPIAPPQFQQPSPVYRTRTQSPPSRRRERIKVIQPPPLYIKAPPPKVVVVKEPPKIIQTPPRVIREVVDRPVPVEKEVFVEKPMPYPVEKEVIRDVPYPVEVPVHVRSPTPPPVYLQPEVIEREVPYPVEVPVPVRGPTPPPEFIRVPEYIQVPVEVPVPYEVRAPTPPPQFIEVPVQVPFPVYVEVEGPTKIIREPPHIEEIPVPYLVEMPYPTPVEVPHFYPVPLKGKKARKGHRDYRYEYYNDQYLDGRYGGGYFIPPQPQHYRPERHHRSRRERRHRSQSSGSSSDGERDDHGLSNGMSGVRITELDDYGRPRQDSPRRDRRSGSRPQSSRNGRADELEGYDFYRPIPEQKSKRKRSKDRRNGDGEYIVRERRHSPNRNNWASDNDRAFSPQSFSEARGYHQMPAYVSDTVSEFPPPPSARRHYYQ